MLAGSHGLAGGSRILSHRRQGLCGSQGGGFGSVGAGATVDPCVNSVSVEVGHDYDEAGLHFLTFSAYNSRSTSPPNSSPSPYRPRLIYTQPPAHSSHNIRYQQTFFRIPLAHHTPCRLHTDTTRGCKMLPSHLSAAALKEGTVAVAAMVQSHLQDASRLAPA